MYKSTDYIYDAASVLEQLTGFAATVENKRKEHDSVVTINGQVFFVKARNEIRKENEGLLINLVFPFEGEYCSFIFIARYISIDTAQTLKSLRINYLDVSGNCYIQTKEFLIYISGRKVQRGQKTNKAKAFRESGIKLLFQLMSNPDNLQLSYRELAELSDISIGSVSNIMKELEEQRFVLKTKNKKALKNKSELLQRWVIAYNDVLRQKLLVKRMSFASKSEYTRWNNTDLSSVSEKTVWGGECAAGILTRNLTPANYTIYTDGTWQSVGKSLKLIPDDNGKVEILRLFYKADEQNTVSPLLIYADLMGSGDSRNIEIAEMILNNELQHLK